MERSYIPKLKDLKMRLGAKAFIGGVSMTIVILAVFVMRIVVEQPSARMSLTITPHSDAITGVCVVGDGQRIVSASWDGSIVITDLKSRSDIECLKGHTDCILGLARLPDDIHVVSGSWDGTVRVWNTRTGKETRRIDFDAPVGGIAVSPDGRRLVVGRFGGQISLHGVPNLYRVQERHMAHLNPRTLVFSRDGQQIVAGGNDGTLYFLSIHDLFSVCEIELGDKPILSVCPSAQGKAIYAGDNCGRVLTYDPGSFQVTSFVAHRGPIWDIAVGSTGETLCTAGGDNTAYVWHLPSTRLNATLTHDCPVWSITTTNGPSGAIVVGSGTAVGSAYTEDRWLGYVGGRKADTVGKIYVWELR